MFLHDTNTFCRAVNVKFWWSHLFRLLFMTSGVGFGFYCFCGDGFFILDSHIFYIMFIKKQAVAQNNSENQLIFPWGPFCVWTKRVFLCFLQLLPFLCSPTVTFLPLDSSGDRCLSRSHSYRLTHNHALINAHRSVVPRGEWLLRENMQHPLVSRHSHSAFKMILLLFVCSFSSLIWSNLFFYAWQSLA